MSAIDDARTRDALARCSVALAVADRQIASLEARLEAAARIRARQRRRITYLQRDVRNARARARAAEDRSRFLHGLLLLHDVTIPARLNAASKIRRRAV